ncbi:hypothetical protein BDQ12DRAFT_628347 [Crucibulum laeve]|uniref:Peptidase M48 domain-containing protein n=1 Tax=Crucibulum laeve TaxID=68775 RepID=A0A5C3M7J1_9AGAR|nr:hypothetical protein BDQ12DRAFT_628347 [Crucibulum laeve]
MFRLLIRSSAAPARRPLGQQILCRSVSSLPRSQPWRISATNLSQRYAPSPPAILRAECRRNMLYVGAAIWMPGSSASFQTTPRNQGGPLIPLFAALLKASTAFEIARTASRIALTFLPVVLVKNHKTRKRYAAAHIHGVPISEEKKDMLKKRIRKGNMALHIMILIPFTLFWATIIASLERTPLTGRWRMIILSPEEEDEIALQLAGPSWYNAVGEILAQDGPPTFIPPTDWRYTWVSDTLRKLEATIPSLAREQEVYPHWTESSEDKPLPPPTQYPLVPRPRASEYLRWFCEAICDRSVPPVPHSIPGAPYSLLVVDKPEASNAFSYGFGPDGGGGIVVYSGFIDDIFRKMPLEYKPTPPEKPSFWSRLFGGLFSSTPPLRPTPTAEQTAELAILLAHELSHLVLSHHLETLSSATVIIPGTLSIASDIIRVLIFPITMLFGPFVNDAVAQLGKVGSGELIKVGEYCTSVKQEIEADVVSARLLAYAGFDARDAVRFWESRSGSATECARAEHVVDVPATKPMTLARRIMGSGHPVNEVRVESLKDELARWESEKRLAVERSRTMRVGLSSPATAS